MVLSLLAFPLLIFVVSAVAFYKQFALLRLYTGTRITELSDLRSGYQKSHGIARAAGVALTAPYSKQKCVFYSHKLQLGELVWKGKAGWRLEWRTVYSKSRSCRTILEDATDQIELTLDLADKHVTSRIYKHDEDSEAAVGLSPEVRKLTYDLEDYRHVEEVIADGDSVFVIGTATKRRSGDWFFHKGADDVFIVSNKSNKDLNSEFFNNVKAPLFGIAFALTWAWCSYCWLT